MSFQVEPKAGPSLVESSVGIQKAQAARDKAISMLMNGAPADQNTTPSEVRQAQTMRQEESEDGQSDTQEASTSEQVEETPAKKEEPLSSQYAILARKEKALRAKAQSQEMAFKQREESLRAREAELSKKDSSYQSDYINKSRFKEDPLTVLSEAGVSYDEITQMLLNQQQVDPATRSLVNELKQEIKALRDNQESTKNSFSEQQSQSYNQAIRQIENETKMLVRQDPAFETIRETNSISDVVELIKKTFDQDGILLSVEEAAQAVEDELVEEAMKITRIKKVQQRLSSANAPTPQQRAVKEEAAPVKTLTNAMSAQRQLSARERALLAFQGKLGK